MIYNNNATLTFKKIIFKVIFLNDRNNRPKTTFLKDR